MLAGFGTMARFPTLEERSERAFRGYMELLEAADWLRAELRLPLELFEVTMGEFRLLYLLHREGALPITEISRRRRSEWNSTVELIGRLEGRGWVRRAVATLPPVEWKRAHLAKSRRNEERRGRRMGVVGTNGGREAVRPAHAAPAHEVRPRAVGGARCAGTGFALSDLPQAAHGKSGEVLRGDQA